MINVGPSRADGVEGVEKLDIASGEIMRQVVRNTLQNQGLVVDPLVEEMLSSGIRKPPPTDDDDRAPRAAG